MEQCPRDPNFKTNVDLEEETERMQRIKDYRTLFSDTMITTTHFLKRCIKVPKTDENTQEQKKFKEAPFKRGIMKFEDYNYNMYNPYILIDHSKGTKTALNKFNSFEEGP